MDRHAGVRRWAGWTTLTVAVAGLTAVVVAGLVVRFAEPGPAPSWTWLAGTVGTVLTGYACHRAAGIPTLDPPARRLWRRLTVTMALLVTALLIDPPGGWGSPVDPVLPAVRTGLSLAAVAVLLWAVVSLPLGRRARADWLAVGLDTATVALAAALFGWHIVIRHPPAEAIGLRQPSFALCLGIVLAAGVLMIVRAASAGPGPLDSGVCALLGGGIAVSAVLTGIAPLSLTPSGPEQAAGSVGWIFWVLAAARQARVRPGWQSTRPSNWMRLRPLPYLAAAATAALLLTAGPRSAGEGRLMVTVAVLMATVLLIRQLLASRDSTGLRARLDASMLALAHQASHDDLSGLPNRSLLLREADAALAAQGATVSLALLDVDDFRCVNDLLGHAVGDELLTRVGTLLQDRLHGHLVARLGGDEFAVLLPGAPVRTEATVVGLIGELDEPITVAGHELLVRVSVGLAHAGPGTSATELLRRADVALYRAKEQGRARHATYDPGLDERTAQHAQLGAEMRQALDRGNEFHLLYQPIVGLPGGQVRGVEALVRWRHPRRGVVAPVDFIGIAERTGVIVPLGRWVLHQACAQAATWARDPAGIAVPISVNVSARQLCEPGFAGEVAEALRQTGLDPRLLTIEVTETAVFDSDEALAALRAVHRLGVSVALDDFGTGHSSLGLLRTCPVDRLKVDKSFIDGVTGTAEQAGIAISLIQITRTLRLSAVAEGVESRAQAQRLYELGYRLAQGFYFAAPLPAEQVRPLLLEGARADAAQAVEGNRVA